MTGHDMSPRVGWICEQNEESLPKFGWIKYQQARWGGGRRWSLTDIQWQHRMTKRRAAAMRWKHQGNQMDDETGNAEKNAELTLQACPKHEAGAGERAACDEGCA